MSYYDYKQTLTKEIQEASFDTLIMAAIKRADDFNLAHLTEAFPQLVEEVKLRYNAPGGALESDGVYRREMGEKQDPEVNILRTYQSSPVHSRGGKE